MPTSSNAARAPAADAELEIRQPTGETIRRTLDGTRFSIGRSDSAQIQLDHPTVSRLHAELYRDPFGRWWIRDLASRYGTEVDRRKVAEQLLTGAERIHLGEIELRLIEGSRVRDTGSYGDQPTIAIRDIAESQVRALQDTRAPRIASEHLSELIRLGTDLSATAGPDARRRLLCEHVTTRLFHGSAALVLRIMLERPDDPPRELCKVLSQGAREGSLNPAYVSRTLLRKVCEIHGPALASNAPVAPVDAQLSLPRAMLELAAVACPLCESRGALDLLYLVLPPEFGTSEWLALASFAAEQYRQAETTWRLQERLREHEAIENDLERAREIQGRLLPREIAVPGIDLAIGFEPCRWVGGDYVDVIALDDGRRLLVIADVSGKGLPAAITTGNLHAIVHAYAAGEFSLPSMVQNINVYLENHLLEDSFVTMLCVALNPLSGEFECVVAGHPPPLRVDSSGDVQAVDVVVHIPLGVEEMLVRSSRGRLEPGQWLVLHTDGVTDVCSEDGERLDDDGLIAMVRSLFGEIRDGDAEEVARRLNQRLDEYQGRAMPVDDRTFVVLRRHTS